MIEDLVASFYKALAVGDRATVEGLLSDQFFAEFAKGLPGSIGGRHVGVEAIDQGWWQIGRLFKVKAVVTEQVKTIDGRLLVLGHYGGTARESGRNLDAAFTHLWTAEGDELTALVQVTDTALWLAALQGE